MKSSSSGPYSLADLHVHSSVSDGRPSPAELVEEARRRGLGVLSVTDHNTFKGSVLASTYARARGLGDDVLVVYGSEVRTDIGDILVYCEEPLATLPRAWVELMDEAEENGCLTVAAHPFDLSRMGVGSRIYEIARHLDAIECYNAQTFSRLNERARSASLVLGKPCIASSDAHVLSYVGVYSSEFPSKPESVGEALELIRRGKLRLRLRKASSTALLERIAWSVVRELRGFGGDL
ncbi:MAG: PHP domain-containing protein [Fervidicoccaceae archaeon]